LFNNKFLFIYVISESRSKKHDHLKSDIFAKPKKGENFDNKRKIPQYEYTKENDKRSSNRAGPDQFNSSIILA
jgi:hypothetical protein